MTRKEAIEILRDTPIDIRSAREDDIYSLYATAQHMAIEALEPKRGHWTDTAGKPNDSQYSLYCSECDEWSEYRSRYCPNCGALMAGVREEDIE